MRHERHLRDSELNALVSLMGDRDRGIADRCSQRLLAAGERAVPLLEEASRSDEPRLRRRAAASLAAIRGHAADRELSRWACAKVPSIDLEKGSLLLARTAYPDLDAAACRARLDQAAAALATRIRGVREPADVADALSEAVAEELHLAGNRADYYDPDNSFLNRVLDRGLGIPISLAAVYLFVARRLALPVAGVGMPGHFILKVGDGDLYVDPFDGGLKLSRHECLGFLARTGLSPDAAYLQPTSDRLILARMVANLEHAYARRRDAVNAGRYRALLATIRGE
jgi:regulator of sirC expression with transglutaminase-like and TPR domain